MMIFPPFIPPHGPDVTSVPANTDQPNGSIPASNLPQPDGKTFQFSVRPMADIKLAATGADNTGPFLPTVRKMLPDDFRYALRP